MSAPWSPTSAPGRGISGAQRGVLEILAVSGAALLAAGAVVKFGAGAAFLVVLVPLALLWLIPRPAWMFSVGIALALVFPYTKSIGTAQAAGFRIAAACAIVTIAVVALRSSLRWRWSVVDIGVLGFLIVTILSWQVWHPGGSAKQTLNPLLPFAFYFGARLLSRASMWRALWVLNVAGALGSLSVLYEFAITKTPLFVSSQDYLWKASSSAIFRPGGVFETPPGAVTVLSLATICGLPLIERHRGWLRAAALGCVVLSLAGAAVTFTRAGYIGLGLGVAAFGLLGGSRAIPPRRALIGLAGLATIFAILFIPIIQHTTWYQQGVARPGTFAARQSYWSLAEPLITDSTKHVLLGHGVNTLPTGLTSATFEPIAAALGTTPVLTQHGPHNQYIRLLLEQGLLGTTLMLIWLVGAPLRAFYHRARVPSEMRPVFAALIGATLSFIAVSFADDTMRAPPSLAAAALVTGMLVTLVARRNETDPGEPL